MTASIVSAGVPHRLVEPGVRGLAGDAKRGTDRLPRHALLTGKGDVLEDVGLHEFEQLRESRKGTGPGLIGGVERRGTVDEVEGVLFGFHASRFLDNLPVCQDSLTDPGRKAPEHTIRTLEDER